MQTYHRTYGIPVHDLNVLKPWASLISEFYSLYPSFLFHSVLKILTVKANFQYLTLNLILSSLRRVEPPGLEPGISACKAEVLANYTMTPLISYQRTLDKSYIRVGFEPTASRFYSGVLPLNYPINNGNRSNSYLHY